MTKTLDARTADHIIEAVSEIARVSGFKVAEGKAFDLSRIVITLHKEECNVSLEFILTGDSTAYLLYKFTVGPLSDRYNLDPQKLLDLYSIHLPPAVSPRPSSIYWVISNAADARSLLRQYAQLAKERDFNPLFRFP